VVALRLKKQPVFNDNAPVTFGCNRGIVVEDTVKMYHSANRRIEKN
jgi:hypothetical protein